MPPTSDTEWTVPWIPCSLRHCAARGPVGKGRCREPRVEARRWCTRHTAMYDHEALVAYQKATGER